MKRAALVFVASAACAYWQEDAAHPATTATTATTAHAADASFAFRLVGSTTIGSSLAPKLVAAYLGKSGATDVKTTTTDTSSTITASREGKPMSVKIDIPGSSGGFKALAGGTAEIAMSSRPIRADESAALHALGDMSSPKCEVVVAMDGIAVVVNKANRVSMLTLPQLADVFGGKTTSWSDVGGASDAIHVFGRDASSGTYELFSQLVLGGRAPVGNRERTSEDVVSDVSSDKNGVGFVGLSFAKDLKAVALRDGDGPAIEPSTLTVSTESYVLSRRLFLYVPEAANAFTRAFVSFVVSDEGQDIVSHEGFVALNSAPVDMPIAQGAPDEYRHLLEGAKRLPFDLRFRSGTADLDTKARSDLNRAARFAAAQGANHVLVAIGFADRSGAEPQNVELSRARAKTVADAVSKIDARASVQTAGFGSALPVAPNDSQPGRERNRRVEVWLR